MMASVQKQNKEEMTDHTLTVANKWCDALSLWPGRVLEETVGQLIPAKQKKKKERWDSHLTHMQPYNITTGRGRRLHSGSSSPVLVDVLDLIDLLLNALAGHAVWLQLVNLLIDQVGDGFVEILQEVLDHLWDDVVGLLLILPFIGQVCFGVTCENKEETQTSYEVLVKTCLALHLLGYILTVYKRR